MLPRSRDSVAHFFEPTHRWLTVRRLKTAVLAGEEICGLHGWV